MQVDRQEFLQQLKTVQPGLALNERIDQGGSFIFRDGKIIAFNSEVMVFAPSGLPDLTGAVHAKELLALVSKLSTEQIDVSFVDGQMVIKSGRARSGIRFDDEIRISVADGIEEYDNAKQHDMPNGLIAALDSARSVLKNIEKLGMKIPPLLSWLVHGAHEKVEQVIKDKLTGTVDRRVGAPDPRENKVERRQGTIDRRTEQRTEEDSNFPVEPPRED